MHYRKACIAERVLFGNERRLSNNNNNKTFRLEQLILFIPHCNNRPRFPLVVFEKETVIPSTTTTKTKRKKKEKEKEKKELSQQKVPFHLLLIISVNPGRCVH